MILRIRDGNGNVQEILAIRGEDGKDYVLTEKDKQEIAAIVAAGAVAPVSIDTSEFALKKDIPDVSGFALKTEIPDVSGFALKTEIPNVSGFAKKTEIPSVPSKVSAFTNDAGYLTATQVQAMIDKAIAKLQGNVVIISFSIEDFQFQAEEGMTWREWVNSEYNTDGACVYNEAGDTIRFVEYSLNVLSPSNAPVKGADTIIPNYFYYLS